MPMFGRAKRASDPLDDDARARLCSAAGSAGADEHDPSTCLSDLVDAFLDPSTDDPDLDGDDAADVPSADVPPAVPGAVRRMLDPPAADDPFRARLLAEVLAGADGGRQLVMARLRGRGYDAGICRTRWGDGGGITAGRHEFIDVVAAPAGRRIRYIVEVEFAAGLEIARPAEGYGRVAEALPRVAVAAEEEMRAAVRAVGDAIARSFRSQGLPVPPWRKSRYLLAKWFGAYRRTVNPALGGGAAARVGGGGEVRCRTVGFHAAPRLGRAAS